MAAVQHDDNALAAISEAEHARAERHEVHDRNASAEPRTSSVAHPEDEKRGLDTGSSSDGDHELDGIHDGLEFPTEEEKRTLRRVADTIPWTAYCQHLYSCT